MARISFVDENDVVLSWVDIEILEDGIVGMSINVHKEANPRAIASMHLLVAAELLHIAGSALADELYAQVKHMLFKIVLDDMLNDNKEESPSEDEQSSTQEGGDDDDYTTGWSINAN